MDMNITDNMKNQWISIDEQKSKIKTIMKSDKCKARRKELKRRRRRRSTMKEYNTNQTSFMLVKVANEMGKKHNQKQPLEVF